MNIMYVCDLVCVNGGNAGRFVWRFRIGNTYPFD